MRDVPDLRGRVGLAGGRAPQDLREGGAGGDEEAGVQGEELAVVRFPGPLEVEGGRDPGAVMVRRLLVARAVRGTDDVR